MKRKFWNWVRNEGERTLFLNGEISDETWYGDEVTPKLFNDELLSGEGDITVWINSPGGDVFAAAQIYNMLMDYKGNVTVKIDGLAASAASVIAMAGTKVQMSPVAMMMIHNPATIAIGDTTEMKKAIEMLDEVKESIMNAYEIKTGLNRTKISHLMDAESWFNARKAVELGFADEILYDKGKEMGITLLTDIDRYTLEGAVIELFYHLQVESGTYETVPMGMFEISEANRSVKCLQIKAYDYMLRFEKDFSGFTTAGTAYQLIVFCCEACGVDFAHSQEEVDSMANGSTLLSLYTENDIETYRDVLFYIGQVLGGFFCINREGKLELRKYGSEPVWEISQEKRFGSSFSDFITRYTAVSSTNLRTQKAEYYSLAVDDGLTMNLGTNPLLQFGLEETREQLCKNILNDISAIAYVPFDSETIGNPALDLGDVIRFSGGQADEEQITCVTSFQLRIGGRHTLKCVGKNPRLAQAKSKNDKNIAGLLNQIEYGKIGFFSFTNAKAVELSETEIKVISIDFTAGEVTQAEFIGLVVLDVSADTVEREAAASGTITVAVPDASTESGTVDVTAAVRLPVVFQEDGKAVVRARYVLNDTGIEVFYPTETYGSGKHTFPLYYPVSNVLPNLLNNFSVYFSVEGGTAVIETGSCIATISGQGMAAQAEAEWDGTIEIEDTYTKWMLTEAVKLKGFSEKVSVGQGVPEAVGL